MQEFAGFCKISVDVRYWLIPSVNTGANAVKADVTDHVLSLFFIVSQEMLIPFPVAFFIALEAGILSLVSVSCTNGHGLVCS